MGEGQRLDPSPDTGVGVWKRRRGQALNGSVAQRRELLTRAVSGGLTNLPQQDTIATQVADSRPGLSNALGKPKHHESFENTHI